MKKCKNYVLKPSRTGISSAETTNGKTSVKLQYETHYLSRNNIYSLFKCRCKTVHIFCHSTEINHKGNIYSISLSLFHMSFQHSTLIQSLNKSFDRYRLLYLRCFEKLSLGGWYVMCVLRL